MLLGAWLRATLDDPLGTTAFTELDLALLARLRAAAALSGEPVADYVRAALLAFVREGDEADWAQAVERMRKGDDAARACLEVALTSRLARDGG